MHGPFYSVRVVEVVGSYFMIREFFKKAEENKVSMRDVMDVLKEKTTEEYVERVKIKNDPKNWGGP